MPRALPLLLLCAAASAAEVVVPPAPPPAFVDMESVTNAALPTAVATARLLRCAIELHATSSNNVEVSFGRDTDGDGLSDASEILLGSDYVSPEIELEVQFPSIGQIMSDPAVFARATNEWALTLSDCTQTPNLRRERGFWISLDTGSNAY